MLLSPDDRVLDALFAEEAEGWPLGVAVQRHEPAIGEHPVAAAGQLVAGTEDREVPPERVGVDVTPVRGASQQVDAVGAGERRPFLLARVPGVRQDVELESGGVGRADELVHGPVGAADESDAAGGAGVSGGCLLDERPDRRGRRRPGGPPMNGHARRRDDVAHCDDDPRAPPRHGVGELCVGRGVRGEGAGADGSEHERRAQPEREVARTGELDRLLR